MNAVPFAAPGLADQGHRLLDLAGDGVAPIVQAGDPVLRVVATSYDGRLADDEPAALIALMRRTISMMRSARLRGTGVAAPRVGRMLYSRSGASMSSQIWRATARSRRSPTARTPREPPGRQ